MRCGRFTRVSPVTRLKLKQLFSRPTPGLPPEGPHAKEIGEMPKHLREVQRQKFRRLKRCIVSGAPETMHGPPDPGGRGIATLVGTPRAQVQCSPLIPAQRASREERSELQIASSTLTHGNTSIQNTPVNTSVLPQLIRWVAYGFRSQKSLMAEPSGAVTRRREKFDGLSGICWPWWLPWAYFLRELS